MADASRLFDIAAAAQRWHRLKEERLRIARRLKEAETAGGFTSELSQQVTRAKQMERRALSELSKLCSNKGEVQDVEAA